MKVTKNVLSETEVVLSVSAEEQEIKPLKEHVLGHFADKMKLAGFRGGKAPLSLVEKNADPASLQSEFLEEAIGTLYQSALSQEKLRVVGNPEISLKKFVPYTTLEFEAKIPVVGDIKLPDYKKMKFQIPEVKVSAQDVSEVLKSLQTRLAEKQEVKRASKNGDEVIIDFKGTDAKNAPVSGADGKDYPLTLGSNAFIPGFEDNVAGMKPDDKKTFTIKFPKDYGVKALASKDVTFAVTLNKVLELTESKIDDDFAAKAGPFKTLEDLKADIKSQLQAERSQEAQRGFESEMVKSISDKSKLSIPQVLIDDTVEYMLREQKQNLAYRGQTYPEYLSTEKMTEAEHKNSLMPDASERVKASLVLAEIADQENLNVTAEELDVRMKILKSQYTDASMQVELDKPETRRDIASRILTEKTISKLKDYTTK